MEHAHGVLLLLLLALMPLFIFFRRAVCSSVDELHAEPSEDVGGSGTSNEQQLPRASNIAFNSLPTMHMNEQVATQEDISLQNQHFFSSDHGGRMYSKSCPVTVTCEESTGSIGSNDFLLPHQRNFFASHWPSESVDEALEVSVLTCSIRYIIV